MAVAMYKGGAHKKCTMITSGASKRGGDFYPARGFGILRQTMMVQYDYCQGIGNDI